jgi:hypothetical protein
MSVMGHSTEYQAAWEKLAACNWDPHQLTAAEERVLCTDAHTRGWLDALRTGRAAGAPSLEKELGQALSRAIKYGDTAGLYAVLERKAPESLKHSILSAVVGGMCKQLHALRQRCEVLEGRAMAMPKFSGSWSGLESYRELEFIVDKGSLWVCTSPNVSCRPGTDGGGKHWRLCCKSGSFSGEAR